MKKWIWITAGVLVAAGVVLLLCGLSGVGFDFGKLSTEGERVERTYVSGGEVRTLQVKDGNADVTLTVSPDSRFHVTCFESDRYTYAISEGDGALRIERQRSKSWFYYLFTMSLQSRPVLTVAVPADFTGDADVQTGNGEITVRIPQAGSLTLETSNHGITAESLALSGKLTAETDNGGVALTDVTASAVSCRSSNGKLSLTRVVTAGDVSCKTSNGLIEWDAVRAENGTAETSNGTISLTNAEVADALRLRTNNKSISLSDVAFGTLLDGHCDNGSIKGTLRGSIGDYSFDCGTSNGHCNLPTDLAGGAKTVRLKTSNGDISVQFAA